MDFLFSDFFSDFLSGIIPAMAGIKDALSNRGDLILILGIISLITFAGTLILLPFLLIRIPEDYFMRSSKPPAQGKALRILFHIVKNLLGLIFFAMGIIMLFIPGQGLLTILASLWLLDLPGKRKIERRLIKRPAIQAAVNGVRQRAGKPPLTLSDQESE
ncbi:MAG: PGPGW domain-containing protein [Spirochaetales bacterium]|nr:PGPGW domain-containing protein [Spirochaetales bacterium]